MLSEIEFKGKKVIILDKAQYVYIMIFMGVRTWSITSISKDSVLVSVEYLYNEDAYEFYKERMESYGFKPFPIIIE